MSKSLYTTIIEETAPTTTTVGVVGQLYLDSTTKILYQCVAINIEDLTYEWKEIGGDKLDKVSTTANYDRVYAVNYLGDQELVRLNQTSASNGSIAQRNSSGQLVVATPTENNHAATKKYVDDKVGSIFRTIFSTASDFKKDAVFTLNQALNSGETIELLLSNGATNSSIFVKLLVPANKCTICIPDFVGGGGAVNYVDLIFTENTITVGASEIELSDYNNWMLRKVLLYKY